MHILKNFFQNIGGGSLAKQKTHSPDGHNKPIVNVLIFKNLFDFLFLFNTSLFAALW